MDCFRFAVVGSGPAGVAAARRLSGNGLVVIDAGDLPGSQFPYPTLDTALASGNVEALLGPHWELLANLVNPSTVHSKLRAAPLKYVASGETFRVYEGSGKLLLQAAGSYAAGGMSNAWGAQLFRYTASDLADAGEWPLEASALEPYYSDLEKHIGIAGTEDDLLEFLGATDCMLPPAPIVPTAQHLLACYRTRKLRRKSTKGLCLGRSRLALITEPYRGHAQYTFGQTEFFSTEQAGIYTARRTLEELLNSGGMTYLRGRRLVAYREHADHVELELSQHRGGERTTLCARHLLIGAGTPHTAQLVLLNRGDVGRRLPFIDHPPTLLPIFVPKLFGSPLPRRSFPVQLAATLVDSGQRDMISFYYPGALPWADMLADVPLPMDCALKLLPNLLAGMLVAQIWERSRPQTGNSLCLERDGTIRIEYPQRTAYARLGQLLAALRPLGAFSMRRLAVMAPPGWGFHYAGCLPMRRAPRAYETHVDGRLWDSNRVRVLDGSVLPTLPAKNHSLTLMANAARIADDTLRCGY